MFKIDAAKFFETTLVAPIAEFFSTKHEITFLIRIEKYAIATFFQEPTLNEDFLRFLGFLQLLLLLKLRQWKFFMFFEQIKVAITKFNILIESDICRSWNKTWLFGRTKYALFLNILEICRSFVDIFGSICSILGSILVFECWRSS